MRSTSSDAPALLEPDDLSDGEVDRLLARAATLAIGEPPAVRTGGGAIGLLFLSSSLRTLVGFSAAAIRLGLTPISISEPRWDPNMSAAESFEDTLRTITGMLDAVVVRAPVDLRQMLAARRPDCPVVNGGDLRHHPTQALIDLFAIERLRGPIGQVRLALCGDLTMRASRSLLQLLARRPPEQLVLVAPDGRRGHGIELGTELERRTSWRDPGDLSELDTVLVVGLAPGTGDGFLDEPTRRRWAVTAAWLATLPADGIVLSPMPVIDEISDDGRADRRIRMFEQNDLSLFVRVAVLEWALRLG